MRPGRLFENFRIVTVHDAGLLHPIDARPFARDDPDFIPRSKVRQERGPAVAVSGEHAVPSLSGKGRAAHVPEAECHGAARGAGQDDAMDAEPRNLDAGQRVKVGPRPGPVRKPILQLRGEGTIEEPLGKPALCLEIGLAPDERDPGRQERHRRDRQEPWSDHPRALHAIQASRAPTRLSTKPMRASNGPSVPPCGSVPASTAWFGIRTQFAVPSAVGVSSTATRLV